MITVYNIITVSRHNLKLVGKSVDVHCAHQNGKKEAKTKSRTTLYCETERTRWRREQAGETKDIRNVSLQSSLRFILAFDWMLVSTSNEIQGCDIWILYVLSLDLLCSMLVCILNIRVVCSFYVSSLCICDLHHIHTCVTVFRLFWNITIWIIIIQWFW